MQKAIQRSKAWTRRKIPHLRSRCFWKNSFCFCCSPLALTADLRCRFQRRRDAEFDENRVTVGREERLYLPPPIQFMAIASEVNSQVMGGERRARS